MMTIDELYINVVELLKQLIATPSFSKEENKTADIIVSFFQSKNISTNRYLNNIWAVNKYFAKNKPTILLNSHHDTVKPNKAYTVDPFVPTEKDGKLFGLGSNDAGGCLVALIAAFIHYYDHPNLKYNLVIAATAEEEISGYNGVEALLINEEFITETRGAFQPPLSSKGTFGIVGEPTLLNMAIAEKGLLVLDCIAYGKPGHAAREEGDNAIYIAMADIEWFQKYKFDKVSDLLGSIKMSVTIINAGSQHNVVPAECKFTVDVRVNELYTFDEVLSIINKNVKCEVRPRSARLRSTAIPLDHPIIMSGINLGKPHFGSPTTSDKALMDFPTLKMGPGDSARSHSADEFIYKEEIKNGIIAYIALLKEVLY